MTKPTVTRLAEHGQFKREQKLKEQNRKNVKEIKQHPESKSKSETNAIEMTENRDLSQNQK